MTTRQQKKPPGDKPRAEIVAMAEHILEAAAGRAEVFFKFTCSYCGQRCTMSDANSLPDLGECFHCGRETAISEAGFMLMLSFDPNRPKAGAIPIAEGGSDGEANRADEPHTGGEQR